MGSPVPVAHTNDRPKAIAAIVAAFIGDPFVRWIYPDAETYLRVFPLIAEAFAGKAFDTGSAHSSPGHEAVALWLGPGVESDGERMSRLTAETVPGYRIEELASVVEQMAEYHPHEPHWYLPLVGVDPAHQRRGLGSALLAYATALFDAAGLPAYLEATSDTNRQLYERYEFTVTGKIQAGSSPPMWPMRREPR